MQTIEQKTAPGTVLNNNSNIPKSLEPLTIKGVTFANRIVLSPLCMYSCTNGFFNDWHLAHLGQYAIRGVGLIFTEATAVQPNGRISPYDAGIWKDEHIPSFRRVVDFVHSLKSKIGIQLAHAGRKASAHPPFGENPDGLAGSEAGGWTDVFGPSSIPWSDNYLTPIEMTTDLIKEFVESFKEAALRADKAGFDVIEIHSAHGYLLHSFLSPLTNKRKDNYGGSFENRIRLLEEIIVEVKKVWPSNKPIFVRISCTDWVNDEESWDIKQSVKLSKRLHELDVDLVDCSTGGNSEKQKIPAKPNFQVTFAKEIKQNVEGIKTGAVGLILDSESANKIIENNDADLVFLGRELLRNPSFVLNLSNHYNTPVVWPNQYERARPRHELPQNH